MLHEEVPAERLADRRDRERYREQPQRPQTRLDLQLADRIRAELVVRELPGDPGEGRKGREKDRGLLP
jgi:hypothetical protein